MAQVGIKELLEAGVHFGHQTRRWNPKMRRFIHGERAGIHIIDLQQTEVLLAQAQEFASDLAGRGGTILFVGTKKQASDSVRDAAKAAGMPYINERWLGGLLTNFATISKRIERLHELRDWTESGTLELLPTRERISAMAERDKLETNLGGVADMQRVPEAVMIVDLKTEVIGVAEAQRLRIPIIGLVDTNCDPDPVEYVIPGNDDAIRSCKLIIDAIASPVGERANAFRAQEAKERAEAEQRARDQADQERARKEAEEARRLQAEEDSARMAQEREAEAEAAAAAARASEAAATEAREAAEAQTAATAAAEASEAAEEAPAEEGTADGAPAEEAPEPEPAAKSEEKG